MIHLENIKGKKGEDEQEGNKKGKRKKEKREEKREAEAKHGGGEKPFISLVLLKNKRFLQLLFKMKAFSTAFEILKCINFNSTTQTLIPMPRRNI